MNTMATHIIIDKALDFWEELAQVVQTKKDLNNGVVPHGDADIFDICIHKRDRQAWMDLVNVARQLHSESPEMFNKDHVEVLNELTQILLTDYEELYDDELPLDYYKHKRVPLHKGKKMSHWGFRGFVSLNEVWQNCDKPKEAQRLKWYVRQQQEATFRRMFEVKHGGNDKLKPGTIQIKLD